MSERKVLNKYYPPDFDPSKIPRLRLPKDRQYTVRLMAPCNMRCTTCGEYIYKGKKFNARKETVQNEEYLGIKVFRFYIKCPRCLAEITFKTDPQNADYIVEHGATRNFQALKLAEEQAEREAKEIEDEEKNNPMMLLENRTKASKQEMDLLEALEDLKDLNQRQASVDFEGMLNKFVVKKNEADKKTQEDEDEDFIKAVFGKAEGPIIKRLADEESDEEIIEPVKKVIKIEKEKKKPTEILTSEKMPETITSKPKAWEKKSVGVLGKKSSLSSLVRVKPAAIKVQEKPAEKLAAPQSNALNLLGAYSGSESD